MATITTAQPAPASSLKQAIIRHPLVACVTLAILVLSVVHFVVRPLAAASGPARRMLHGSTPSCATRCSGMEFPVSA